MRISCHFIKCPKRIVHRRLFTNSEQKLLIRENDRSFYINEKTKVVHVEEGRGTVTQTIPFAQRAQNYAYKFFLPAGYPKSVHSDYSKFYSWTALQGIAGSASYVISTQSLLTAIGIGQELALPGAAAISWVLKDGLGSMGMMLLASKFGTRFDIDTKRTKWRADIIHNIGVGLELLTPLLPKYFLILASLANVAKGLAGITSGATRAALNKHFSRSENLGDITAKAQTQGIATYLIGMCLGIGISTLPWIYPGSLSIFATFGVLASVHIYASYRALSSVSLSTLNNQRSSLLISEFLQNIPLSNPDQLRSQDFIISSSSSFLSSHIKLGSNISESVSTIQYLPNLINIYSEEQYILNFNNNNYFILLKESTESIDIMKAYFNAHVLYYLFHQNDSLQAMKQALQFTNQNFPKFINEAHSKNWNSSQFLLFCHDNKIKI